MVNIFIRRQKVGMSNLTIQNPEAFEIQTFLKIRSQMVWFFKSLAKALAAVMVPTELVPSPEMRALKSYSDDRLLLLTGKKIVEKLSAIQIMNPITD